MIDSHDPTIRALMVELGMSAEDAPSWEAIENEASQVQHMTTPVLRRSVPGWAVALATAVVALISIGGTLLLLDLQSEVAQTPSTVATTAVPITTAPPVTTTVAPSSTAAVEALVEEYYAAYNAGDAERAIGLLSATMRMTSPAELRFRIEELGERVDALCIPASEYPGAVVCAEAYTDPLHGAAGLSLETSFLYAESDGVLLQTPDPGAIYTYPGCLSNRCPQNYDEFAADLFRWLQTARPDVANGIGDANRLNYFAANREAVAAAQPFAREFVAQSPDWGRSSSPPIAGMTALAAVEAHYAARNSRTSAGYEAFFGEPPPDGLLWLWEMGTTWEAQCAADAGNNDVVRCEEEVSDDFYSKAGAEFHYRTLWRVADGRMLETREWEMTSGYWAYTDLEYDFGDWLRSAYPDEYLIVFAGARLARTPEAAGIAMTRIDEFLEQSADYRRSPDPLNQISTSTG